MSVSVMAPVWLIEMPTPAMKLVALKLADCANDERVMDGMPAWAWFASAVVAVALYFLVPGIRRQAQREIHGFLEAPVASAVATLLLAILILATLLAVGLVAGAVRVPFGA